MWLDIFKGLLDSGKTMADINARIKLYYKYGVISEDEKIEIYVALLEGNYYTTTDLDTYVSQGFLTETEKETIISQANLA
jgi:hypothetical protein